MPTDDVVARLDEHAVALESTHPDSDSEIPGQFRSAVEAADIVGLGEATHGTREIFKLKHRLVRHLVGRGFRTVAIETDFVNTLAASDFVHHGAGTPQEALDDVILWVWKTAEIRSLLAWLRAFNEDRPPEDRVRVHGISLSSPDRPASQLREYLQRTDDISSPETTVLDRVADEEIPEIPTDREAFLERGTSVARELRSYLDEHRPEYVDAQSVREWTIARQLCRHLEQNCEWNRMRLSTPGTFDPEAFELRDEYMAENASWCLETDPGAGVVVWAHNTHVKRGSFDMPHEWAAGNTMGEFLAREHGSAYRPYATDFARGEYRAVPNGETDQRTPQSFEVEEPPEATLTGTLATLEQSPLFLDVETAAKDPRLDDWLDQKRQLRAVPALVDPTADRESRTIETDLAAAFDGLFYLHETSPSVPLSEEGAEE